MRSWLRPGCAIAQRLPRAIAFSAVVLNLSPYPPLSRSRRVRPTREVPLQVSTQKHHLSPSFG
ncbi:hypothetical protein [Limnospira platensis]|uniref:hypothetical protein n=1 Tax=Limnospira platensis TaxID=118562 RepID=UPI0021A9C214